MRKPVPVKSQTDVQKLVAASTAGSLEVLAQLISLHPHSVDRRWDVLHITPVLAAVLRGQSDAGQQ